MVANVLSTSGSRHTVASIAETVKGTTPDTPAFQKKRYRSCTLALDRATLQSEEIRDDRQISDFRLGVRSGGGNVVGEVSTGTYDDWIEAGLMGSWSAAGNGSTLKAGVLRRSFSLLRLFQDTEVGQIFPGCEVNTIALAITAGAVVTCTFGFMANDGSLVTDEGGIPEDATLVAYTTTEMLTALTGQLLEGTGAGVATPCTELNINLDNGMQNLNVIGSPNVYDRSYGRSNITGVATFHFKDSTLLQKFQDETPSALKVQLRDALGTSGYDILLPRIKYTGAPNPVNNEGPVTLAMPYQALLDPVTQSNIVITRVLPA